MATRLLRLNSRFKEVGGSNSDFKIVIPVTDLDNVAKITLLSASIPRLFGNIYPGIDKLTFFSPPTGFTTVVIPSGQYTAEELAVVLTDLLPMVVSYVDHRFVFQNSTGSFINIIPAADSFASYLGIIGGLLINAGTTLAAQNPPQLQGPLAIYIQSNAIANNSCLDILANGLSLPVVVPIHSGSVPYGFNINWIAPTQDEWLLLYTQFPDGQTLRQLDIRICDCYGNVLLFPDNAFSDFVFKISYAEKDTTSTY